MSTNGTTTTTTTTTTVVGLPQQISKPLSVPSATGQLVTPLGALRDDPLPDAFQMSARSLARELLPFNYGRQLESSGEQTLQSVGAPTRRQLESGRQAPLLFHPLIVRGRILSKNRVWVSPMCTYSADDGFLNDWHLAHLGSFAIGGAGLIIVEATAVAFEGRISPTDSGLWKDAQIEPLQRITALLKSQHATPGIQLAHAGRKASTLPMFQVPRETPLAEAVDERLGGWPSAVIAPSSIAFAGDYWRPVEMTREQIGQVKEQFIAAARRAVTAGFEYIEIHAAHGYLLTEFLSSTSNHRTDEYGGEFDNRTRLLREIVTSVKAILPESVVLGVRVSGTEWTADGWTIDETNRLVGQLSTLGVDLIDMSSGGNSVTQKITVGPGYQVPLAESVKKAHPTMLVGAVGMITEAQQAEDILQKGQADVVLIAREFLRNPHWTKDAARQLGFDMEWAPQYQRAKPSAKQASGPR